MIQAGKVVPLDREVAAAVVRLGLDHASTVRLMTAYTSAIFHFRVEQVAMLRAGDTAEQVTILADLALSMRNAVIELTEMPPEYQEALGQSINKHAWLDRDVPAVDLLLAVAAALDDLTDFLKPPANRPTNKALERAMRILLPAIEEAAGSPAKIKWNRVTQKSPESASHVTDALLVMFKNLDRRLKDTTIFNMIEKVRKKPEKT